MNLPHFAHALCPHRYKNGMVAKIIEVMFHLFEMASRNKHMKTYHTY